MLQRCPTLGTTTSVEAEIAAWRSSATVRGARRSSAPYTNSVGTLTRGRAARSPRRTHAPWPGSRPDETSSVSHRTHQPTPPGCVGEHRRACGCLLKGCASFCWERTDRGCAETVEETCQTDRQRDL